MTDSKMTIETIMTQFGRYADTNDGLAMSLLFSKRGTLNVNGKIASGREEIVQMMDARRALPAGKTRHLWSNLLIDEEEVHQLTASHLQITFEQKILDAAASVRVSDVIDIFERDITGEWRMTNRTITRQITVGV